MASEADDRFGGATRTPAEIGHFIWLPWDRSRPLAASISPAGAVRMLALLAESGDGLNSAAAEHRSIEISASIETSSIATSSSSDCAAPSSDGLSDPISGAQKVNGAPTPGRSTAASGHDIAGWRSLLASEPGLMAWAAHHLAIAGDAHPSQTRAARWLAAHFLEACSAWTGEAPPDGLIQPGDAEARPSDLPRCDANPARDASPAPAQNVSWGPNAAWVPAAAAKLARLAALERRFQQCLEAAKLDAMKELAYGAGHEINNPLANISARAQTLLEDERDPERRRRLAAINAQAFRAHEMIADMMLFARPPAPTPAVIDARGVVATVVERLEDAAREQQTALRFDSRGEDFRISADAAQIAVAVRALCVNSLEALGSGGEVTITVQAEAHGSDAASGALEIVVADTGPGFSPHAARHAFDPFFSGREAGRGLGFGLSKCWRIVTNHGGHVVIGNAPTGAVARILLPRRGVDPAKPAC